MADADGQQGDDGEAGEADTIAADVEDISGGAGNDVLAGNPLSNFFWGLAGDDTIVVSGDGVTDYVSCGTGTDTVTADTVDEIATDCENVTRVGRWWRRRRWWWWWRERCC